MSKDIFDNYDDVIEEYYKRFYDGDIKEKRYKIGFGDNQVYIDFVPSGFDIETTTQYKKDSKGKVIAHFSNMYIWQFGFDNYNFFGRTWYDFHILLESIKKHSRRKFLLFIHNCSFESSFMLRELQLLGHEIKVFARKSRHPLKVEIDDKIIILDSALITGFPLQKLAENYTITQKLVGDLDYSLIRNKYTKLDEKTELAYCRNDVRILVEYANYYKDKYLSKGFLPMTSTMIASQVVKDKIKELKASKEKRDIVFFNYPKSQNQYDYIMSYYTGAYTHGMLRNLFTTHENCLAYDVTSEYPFALMNYYYPMGKFKAITKYVLKNKKLMDNLLSQYCVLVDVTFENIRTKTGVTILSKNKIQCENVSRETLFDNGRLYSADKCHARVTEVDLQYLSMHYDWDSITFNHGLYCKRGKLPNYFRLAIAELYCLKSTLKHDDTKRIELMEAKKKLNGLYGFLCTKLSLDEILFGADGWETTPSPNDFYKLRQTKIVLPQWAIYCTSWSKYLLLSTIKKITDVNPSDYIYSDTDSCKTKNKKYIVDIFNSVNAEIRKNNETWITELNLREKYPEVDFSEMGTFDREKDLKRLKVLGSKRYLVEYYNGEFESTVAGLNKKAFLDYCTKQGKDTFSLFTKDGLQVADDESQKLGAFYEDNPKTFEVTDYQGNTEIVTTQSYVSLIPITFKMTITKDLLRVYEYECDRLGKKMNV